MIFELLFELKFKVISADTIPCITLWNVLLFVNLRGYLSKAVRICGRARLTNSGRGEGGEGLESNQILLLFQLCYFSYYCYFNYCYFDLGKVKIEFSVVSDRGSVSYQILFNGSKNIVPSRRKLKFEILKIQARERSQITSSKIIFPRLFSAKHMDDNI